MGLARAGGGGREKGAVLELLLPPELLGPTSLSGSPPNFVVPDGIPEGCGIRVWSHSRCY